MRGRGIATVQVLITLCIRALPGEQPEPRCSVGPAGEAEEGALLCASAVSVQAKTECLVQVYNACHRQMFLHSAEGRHSFLPLGAVSRLASVEPSLKVVETVPSALNMNILFW